MTALDWLDDDGSQFIGVSLNESYRFGAAVIQHVDIVDFLLRNPGCDRGGADNSGLGFDPFNQHFIERAMVGASEQDDLLSTARGTRYSNRRHDRLGPGATERSRLPT